jgi:CBS domain-containing protein
MNRLVEILQPECPMPPNPRELTVAELMTSSPTTLSARHHLARAAEEMELGRIRHVPIVDTDGRLLGLVTHRDVLAAGENLKRPLSEVMLADLKTLRPSTPARDAAYLMIHHAIGCVPIVEADNTLVGIITDTDFVRAAYTLLGGTVSIDDLESEEHEADNV